MNRIVFVDSRIRSSSQILPGTSRKLSGSSSSSTSSGPRSRNSSTSRFCSPPDSVVEVAVLRPVVGHAERGRRAHVPDDLDVVAAGVGVLRQRLGVAHLGLLVVGVHQRQLAGARRRAAASRTRGGDTESSRSATARRAGADHLAHHAEPAGAGDRAGVRRQVAGDDPQQRGLAGAVGADQRDLGALADPERHVVEQHPPVRQLVAHSGDVHVSHERQCPRRVAPTRADNRRRRA